MPRADGTGSLGILATPDARPLVEDWIPRRHPHTRALRARRAPSLPRARLLVRTAAAATAAPCNGEAFDTLPDLLHLRGAVARRLSPDAIQVRTPEGSAGRVDLEALTARLTLRLPRAEPRSAEAFAIHAMLTIAAALLLGRMGAALVHGAGIVDPRGRAWLLVGDTHAGKSTTCTSLVAHGWRFLADDQVILHARGDGTLALSGWPRRAHLDRGWDHARVTGVRDEVDLTTRWGDRWLPHAPLAGVVLPCVIAGAATHGAPLGAPAALEALVRQSPWLLADAAVARAQLALLARAAALPSRRLVLGTDSYARGDVLARVLEEEAVEPLPGTRD